MASSEDIEANVDIGTVVCYCEQTGIGSISYLSGTIAVYRNDIIASGYQTLVANQTVRFNVAGNPDRAVNIYIFLA